MRIESLTTHLVRLPFAQPMRVAGGEYADRKMLLVHVTTVDGASGWGECAALDTDTYFHEDIAHARRSLDGPIRDALAGAEVFAVEVAERVTALPDVGPMATAAIEMAVFDAELKHTGVSLASWLGATQDRVGVSVAVGIHADRSIEDLIRQVRAIHALGARCVKLKIAPGWDIEPVRAIRDIYGPGALQLIADANQSFEGADTAALFDIAAADVLIEQPLDRKNIEGHAALLEGGLSSVCLDEAIESIDDIRNAVQARAAHVIVLKPGRMGGILATQGARKWCEDNGVKTRIGGMFSAALGNHVERAFAADSEVQSDIAPLAARFDGNDLVDVRDKVLNGTVSIWNAPGVGPAPDPALVAHFKA